MKLISTTPVAFGNEYLRRLVTNDPLMWPGLYSVQVLWRLAWLYATCVPNSLDVITSILGDYGIPYCDQLDANEFIEPIVTFKRTACDQVSVFIEWSYNRRGMLSGSLHTVEITRTNAEEWMTKLVCRCGARENRLDLNAELRTRTGIMVPELASAVASSLLDPVGFTLASHGWHADGLAVNHRHTRRLIVFFESDIPVWDILDELRTWASFYGYQYVSTDELLAGQCKLMRSVTKDGNSNKEYYQRNKAVLDSIISSLVREWDNRNSSHIVLFTDNPLLLECADYFLVRPWVVDHLTPRIEPVNRHFSGALPQEQLLAAAQRGLRLGKPTITCDPTAHATAVKLFETIGQSGFFLQDE